MNLGRTNLVRMQTNLPELYPAIDVRGGKCVRLQQGDYARETTYGEDPVAVAVSFAQAGARWIHTVDLDAARSGDGINRSVIAAIAAAVGPLGAQVQTGGGVRNPESVRDLLSRGVARVVIGTAAVEDPEFVDRMCAEFPGQIAVGLDARRGTDGTYEVAVRGWTEGSGVELFGLLQRFEERGVAAVIITEIGRDGMLTGPDNDGLQRALDASTIGVIASGGVSSLADVVALGSMRSGAPKPGRSLLGVIAGKAIYEHRLTVAEGVIVLAKHSEHSEHSEHGANSGGLSS
jgi:phosphoribosylformimino-5-aminoimidazole carboxamide ribotide isomerase